MAAPSNCEGIIVLGNVSAKKSEKKSRRKLNRVLNGLVRRNEVEIAASPTVYIMVGNAGHTTGISPYKLLTLFKEFDVTVHNIIMPIGESHCFLEFANVGDAVTAMDKVHGKKNTGLLAASNSRPLYLAFVQRIPENMDNADTQIPPGLILLDDIVTEDEETLLLNCIQWDDNIENERQMKHRRVKHFGYAFCYETNNVDRDHPIANSIPQPCMELLRNLHTKKVINSMPNQLTVNQYQPGQGIPPHVDTHSAFEDEILSLSLGSDIVMDFRHKGIQSPILLSRRSLLIMTGASRYLWSHGITPRKMDVILAKNSDGNINITQRGIRTSFTFRTVRQESCRCPYVEQCDSQVTLSSNSSTLEETVSKEEIQRIEELHVHQVYDTIANHFSDTRHKAWSRVEEFIQELPIGTLLLDVGCGNGKYLNINPSIYKAGCDQSEKLMQICSQRGCEGFCCNALHLPVRSEAFDACLCIAMIHHLATQERRTNAVAELVRVLKPGGKGLIYVWAMEQNFNKTKSNYISPFRQMCKQQAVNSKISGGITTELAKHNSVLPVHVNRTQFETQDILVPWHLQSKKSMSAGVENTEDENQHIFHRYYHVFQESELESLCKGIQGITIITSYYDAGNWCVVLEKSI